MTTAQPHIIWTGTVQSGTFRLVDMGAGAAVRFLLEQQQPPDALGSQGWSGIGLPFVDVLEAAFSALYASPQAPIGPTAPTARAAVRKMQ